MGALKVDASEYKALVQRLRAADRSVQTSLRRRLREAGKPLADAVIQEGPEGLPEGGGLADFLRSAKGGLSMTATRLQIRLSYGKHDLAAVNRGRLRHPVFGHRRTWVNQSVAAGTYDKAIEKHADEAGREIEQVLDDIARELS